MIYKPGVLLMAVTWIGSNAGAQTPVPGGKLLWALRIGGPEADFCSDVSFFADGSCVVAGEFRGSMDLAGQILVSKGETDMFVAKISRQGVVQWAGSGGSPFVDRGLAIEVKTGAGGLQTALLWGSGAGTVDFGGSSLFSPSESIWTAEYSLGGINTARGIAPLGALPIPSRRAEIKPHYGSVICGGFDVRLPLTAAASTHLVSRGGQDYYLAEYPVLTTSAVPLPTPTWSVSGGGIREDSAAAVALAPYRAGDLASCIVVGSFEDTCFLGSTDGVDATLSAAVPSASLPSGRPDCFVAKYTLADGDGDGRSDISESQP